MGLFDTLLGRTKPVRANLDALFALPSAAITLQVTSGLVATNRAGVCFKPPAGQSFADMQNELEQLLAVPDDTGGAASTVRHVGDKFGYRWIIVEAGALDDLVTRVHMVHSSLQDAGWSTQLLCSVFGFAPGAASIGASSSGAGGADGADGAGGAGGAGNPPGAGDGTAASGDMSDVDIATTSADTVTRPVYIVYLAKQGTFYPFAPTGAEQRDTELELRIRSVVSGDLPIEADLSRWFPIWDLPIT